MQLHKLKKALWTPNNVQNIGVIDNLQPKLLPFYRDELLHSRPTDCHQLKAIGVAHIVTAPDLNLSLFAVLGEQQRGDMWVIKDLVEVPKTLRPGNYVFSELNGKTARNEDFI